MSGGARSEERRRFGIPEEDVEVLHRGPGGALDQVVDRRNGNDSVADDADGQVAAVRVRPMKPIKKQAAKCADCGGDILPAQGKGADYIAAGTKKAYGVALCWGCACKRKESALTEGVVTNGTDEAE